MLSCLILYVLRYKQALTVSIIDEKQFLEGHLPELRLLLYSTEYW